jgi:hypothetical protein
VQSYPIRLSLSALDVHLDGTDDCNYRFRLKLLNCPGKSNFAVRTNSLALLLIQTIHWPSTQVHQITPKILIVGSFVSDCGWITANRMSPIRFLTEIKQE